MTRDLVDQMGDTGRAPRDLSDEHDRVQKSDLHDFMMALHYDNPVKKAIWVSMTGEASKAVWLARSQIEFTDTGKTTPAIRTDGRRETVKLVEVTIPEWLAKDKGLI